MSEAQSKTTSELLNLLIDIAICFSVHCTRQTPLSNFITKLYPFYFPAALVFERHGLYTNTEKV